MRFMDNKDGTITDARTGLIWSAENYGPMTWEEAIEFCKGLMLAGYSDWRLSSIEELLTLVDYSRFKPATEMSGMLSSNYWSSTIDAYYTYYVWGVNFSYGRSYDNYRSDSYYIRAIRGQDERKRR